MVPENGAMEETQSSRGRSSSRKGKGRTKTDHLFGKGKNREGGSWQIYGLI